MARLVVLGSGTSTGVPMLGCGCAVCRSADPRDRRLRPSVLFEGGETRVVVDTTPEFRIQGLRAGLDHLNAVFLTHPHADHVAGLDDVRAFTMRTRRPVSVYADADTLEAVRTRFAYIFGPPYVGGNLPLLDLCELAGPVTVGPLTFQPLEVFHGPMPVTAFRVGGLAYVTDVNRIPDAARAELRGLDTLIMSGACVRPHPTHFTLDEALAEIEDLRPRRAYLTHLGHQVSHARTSRGLPPGVALAYDGLSIEF